MGEALNVPDEGRQGKSSDFPHSAHAHEGQELRLRQHLLRNEAVPVLTLLAGMTQLRPECPRAPR